MATVAQSPPKLTLKSSSYSLPLSPSLSLPRLSLSLSLTLSVSPTQPKHIQRSLEPRRARKTAKTAQKKNRPHPEGSCCSAEATLTALSDGRQLKEQPK